MAHDLANAIAWSPGHDVRQRTNQNESSLRRGHRQLEEDGASDDQWLAQLETEVTLDADITWPSSRKEQLMRVARKGGPDVHRSE
jgi:hypothetical protein